VADPRPPEFDVIILAGGRGARLGGADKPGLVVGPATMAATAARAAVAAGAHRIILVGPDRPEVTAATTATDRPGPPAAPDVAGAAAGPAQAMPGPAGGANAAGVADTTADPGAAGDPGDGGGRARLIVTREDPPGAGPVPALRAGLAAAAAPWVAVLAADLPFLRGAQLRSLLAATQGGPAGDDPAGAVVADESGAEQWLAGCWRTGLLRAALAAYQGSSLRGLLGPLRPVLVRDDGPGDGPPPWLDCDTPAELAAARAWLAAPAAVPPEAAAGPPGAGPGPATPGAYRTECDTQPRTAAPAGPGGRRCSGHDA
jgi:molybdopterin-guanine dinucleotide biosynthesis protein A